MGIRGAYAIRPYTCTLKMGWDGIRSTSDRPVRGTYAIRPQTDSGNLAFGSLVLLCRQVNVGIARTTRVAATRAAATFRLLAAIAFGLLARATAASGLLRRILFGKMNVGLPVILRLLRLRILGRLGILRLARFGILGHMGILRIGRLFLLLGRGPPLRDALVIALVNAVG